MGPSANYKQLLIRYHKDRQRNVLANPGQNDMVLILDHLKPSYNVAKIFRSAEAFGAHAVHLIGIGPFDPAPAKGSFRKVPARFHEQFKDCYEELSAKGYKVYIIEPDAKQTLMATKMPRLSAFVLGHEEFGHSFNREAFPCLEALAIPQFGSVQSLNVSIAASVVMYEYLRQHPTEREP
ncbi:MAG: TrmH family RNA methyltransferase [Deltaproteobacteria bacterium]|jgi:tRNA G18 (ribose-2'-O)-methylase SpoU|nr:TrmH family RNA methyltransferase [Deltaproteobacteria bacterium]MBW2519360.1 TrmH family RNA methyltransferase [Deltaproteobacteria bacterium]